MKPEPGDWHSTKIPSCYFSASLQKHAQCGIFSLSADIYHVQYLLIKTALFEHVEYL